MSAVKAKRTLIGIEIPRNNLPAIISALERLEKLESQTVSIRQIDLSKDKMP